MIRKSPIARRVLLALFAAGSIAAAIGACGSENAAQSFDMGGGSDLGSAGSDMGAASDGGGQSTKVTLATPAPWQSYVATTTDFQFLATLPTMTPQGLEPYVQVTPYPTGAALSGAFNWTATGPAAYQLNFMPAALTDGTDYVVTVESPTGGAPLLKTGVSIGSNPRVIHVKLTVKKNADAVGFVVTFSEPMEPTSTKSQIALTAGGAVVPATVAEQAGSTDHLAFTLDVTSPHGLATPLVFYVKSGAMAPSMVMLNPMSWDSPTDDGNGNFMWKPTLPAVLDTIAADTTYDFVPTLN
jgi:hypothetical protein